MIDYKKETSKVIAEISKNLAQFVASQSFEFWQRKDFRLYVEFGNISKEEQDRMFNELEVSLLGLFTFKLRDSYSQNSKDEKKLVLSAIEKDLSSAFLQIFIELGIEEKHIKLWKKLIQMKMDEYEDHLKISLKESKKIQELKKDEEDLRRSWARIETITIDCLTHIRRGKVEKDDPLWKLLRKWLITVDANLTPLASF